MKQLEFYDFNLAAGQSRDYPVQGDYVRVISATGDINIIGDTFGKLGPVRVGQGLEKTKYNRLTIQNVSGGPNAGKILVSESNFIDQTLSGTVSVRPEQQSGNFTSMFLSPANSPDTVFGPAANVNGALILSASMHAISSAGTNIALGGLYAKNGAPVNAADGALIMPLLTLAFISSSTFVSGNDLRIPQFIGAGLGLYFYSTQSVTASQRACRYRLL